MSAAPAQCDLTQNGLFYTVGSLCAAEGPDTESLFPDKMSEDYRFLGGVEQTTVSQHTAAV